MADDGGDAAGCCGLTGRGKRLAVAGAGLADKSAHVDQAGGDDLAGTIDDVGALGHAGSPNAALVVSDDAVGDQDVAGAVEIARGIDHTGVGEEDGAAIG